MTPPVVQLASPWLLLAAALMGSALVGGTICFLLWRILDRQYATFRDDHRDTRAFTSAAIEALRDIKNACDRCHLATVATVKLEMGAVGDKIVAHMRTEHELTRAGSKDIVAAIGREEDRTVNAVKDVREAVDRNYELLKQQAISPPVLGVGSQVRDSVAAK